MGRPGVEKTVSSGTLIFFTAKMPSKLVGAREIRCSGSKWLKPRYIRKKVG
ncbi:hypothetical protein [Okeania sp. SIO2C2]|uniref:hypothetical protein n=1 Tax=Okeania sp. SIO2C2 TaxID=2607787 RepID=UPI00257FB983|nr:hypothetical protein [Okeania sp. SIO2C2]